MKNLFFVIIPVACGLLILAGCGNKSDGPRRPITTEQPAPQPPAPKPEPPKVDMVTLTSSAPFTVFDLYNVTTQHTADATKTRPRQDFDKVLYATILHPGEGYQSAVKVIRIPPSVFADPNVKSLNLDDPKLEVLPAAGWRIGNRITVYIFKSEFGSTANDRKVSIGGGEGEGKTLDELQRSPYFWRIVRSSAGTIYAEPDERGMLASFSLDGINAFLAYAQAKDLHKNSVAAIKAGGDENYSAGYQVTYLAGQYQYLRGVFNKLPVPAQMAVIDLLGPQFARLAIEKVGPEAVRRYVTDLTWAQIERCPVVEPSPWPHSDSDAPIANYGGLSKKQYADVGHVMLFWGRCGQPIFERCKAVFQRELGKAPTAPAATGTRRSR